MKRRWGRRTNNMSAVVTAEAGRALDRQRNPPDEALERLLQCRDVEGCAMDEDCANYLRAAAPLVRAAV
eukprot:14255484-Alexandrium_andersonii.AAC.1